MTRKQDPPQPTPEELAERRREMFHWIAAQKRKGAIWVSVGCLANHRIEPREGRA